MTPILIIVLAVTLAGCRPDMRGAAPKDSPATAGAVSYAIVPTAASAPYKLKRSEHAFGAQPVVRDPPVYPASLVDKQLPPVIVHAKAVVDEQGHVVEVREMDDDSTPDHSAFFAACRKAVRQWQFTPMTVVEELDDGKGNITQNRKNAAFSLDYAFRFELVAGKPTVTPQH